MSMICVFVVGHFNPSQVYKADIVVDKALEAAQVEKLQTALDDLFGGGIQVANCLNSNGTLVCGSLTHHETVQVSRAAFHLFGLVTVDIAHHKTVYPQEPFRPNIGYWVDIARIAVPDAGEERLNEAASWLDAQHRRDREFEEEVIRSVLDLRSRRPLDYPGPRADQGPV